MVLKFNQLFSGFVIIFFVGFLPACQIMPTGSRELNAPELQISSVRSKNFDLLVATNKVVPSNELHVYIEGDGTPWVNRYFIAKDPGPYGRLALDLMRQDLHASFYLGRPCYYSWQLPKQDDCSPLLWTDARYSEVVVDSMSTALENYLGLHVFKKVILIGHSGGGTLAYLLSQRIQQVSAVVIISGNLNTDAWTQHHNYTPLRRSINPAELTTIKKLPVIYLTGKKDEVVPLHVNIDFLQRINAKIITRLDYDHVCCWRNEWQSLIQSLTKSL